MTSGNDIKLFVLALVVFLLLDSVWLVRIAPKLYKQYIGHLMAKKPNLQAAGLFYVLYIIGLLVFVLVPAINANSIEHALGYGALFGFFTYATFDLTSQAVFKKWPWAITGIDLFWGSFVTMTTSTVVFALYSQFFK
jgi:hypothetical protein